MPLVPMKAILDATEKYNYAQGAFNVNAVCQAKAVIEVHEMFRSAAIRRQTTPPLNAKGGPFQPAFGKERKGQICRSSQ